MEQEQEDPPAPSANTSDAGEEENQNPAAPLVVSEPTSITNAAATAADAAAANTDGNRTSTFGDTTTTAVPSPDPNPPVEDAEGAVLSASVEDAAVGEAVAASAKDSAVVVVVAGDNDDDETDDRSAKDSDIEAIEPPPPAPKDAITEGDETVEKDDDGDDEQPSEPTKLATDESPPPPAPTPVATELVPATKPDSEGEPGPPPAPESVTAVEPEPMAAGEPDLVVATEPDPETAAPSAAAPAASATEPAVELEPEGATPAPDETQVTLTMEHDATPEEPPPPPCPTDEAMVVDATIVGPKDKGEVDVDEDDDDDEDDPFRRPPPVLPVTSKRKKRRIVVHIPSLAGVLATAATSSTDKAAGESNRTDGGGRVTTTPPPNSFSGPDFSDARELDSDVDDVEMALEFFQEAHEEQDPAFVAFQRQAKIAALHGHLRDIDREDRVSRQEIDDFIRSQLDDKQRSTSLSLEKYKVRADADQKRDLQRLQQLYEQKVQSNQQRIQKGIQMLRERHGKELQALQQRLQQQGQGASFPQAQAQLTAKKQRQLAEFTAKGEEVKQKTESDYQSQMDKIRGNHVQRMAEIQNNRKKILEKLMVSFQQVRQRYLKRHLQRIMKRKEEVLEAIQVLSSSQTKATSDAASGGSLDASSASARTARHSNVSASSSSNDARTASFGGKPAAADSVAAAVFSAGLDGSEDRVEFRQPSPIKSLWPWVEEADHLAGASARHKHRKAIMSQVTRQLSVELHNEGLWVSVHDGPMEDSSPSKAGRPGGVEPGSTPTNKEEEFLLWGTRAHAVLESIVCGEIPPEYDRFDFGDSLSAQGGQVRCVITDLRASDETATEQRAQAVVDCEASEVAELDAKCKEFHRTVAESEAASSKLQEKEKEAEAAVENAALAVEKAKRMKDEFTAKFRSYIGADGNVVQTPNPSDRQELQKALMNYNTNIDNVTRRESAARQMLGEIKSRIQKLQTIIKTSQKNLSTVAGLLKKRKATAETLKSESEKAPMSVKDVIATLRKTAEKRRELMNEKKSVSASNGWVQSFPDLPNSLKKSLWHKMHKRKQQIVLRPTPESIMNQLRSRITENFHAQQSRHSTLSTLEDEMTKAEQLFLLATHPFSQEKLSTIPVTKSGENWAEPGWHLVLDVPPPERNPSHILPCKESFPVLERNVSEIASAPGRQASSLLKLSHFRCLASPLSTVAIASSPAESGGIVPTKATPARGDPLCLSEDAIAASYSFSISKPAAWKASQGRRKSGSSEGGRSEAADASLPKTLSAQQTANSNESPKSDAKLKAEAMKEPPKKNESKRRRSSKTSSEPPTSRHRKNPPMVAEAPPSKKSTETVTNSPRMSQRDHPRPVSDNQSTAAAAAAAAQAAAAAAAAAAAHYNQFMSKMPMQQPNAPHQSPPSHQQQQNLQQFVSQGQVRQPTQGSTAQSQFSNAQQRQLAQLRMMQQQQAPSPHRPQLPPNFPPQPMSMQQFYNPLNHPGTPGRSPFPQQSPNMSSMHMQGRNPVQSQVSASAHSQQGQQQQQLHYQQQQPQQAQQQLHNRNQQQQQQQHQPQKGNQGSSSDSQSDPLFLL